MVGGHARWSQLHAVRTLVDLAVPVQTGHWASAPFQVENLESHQLNVVTAPGMQAAQLHLDWQVMAAQVPVASGKFSARLENDGRVARPESIGEVALRPGITYTLVVDLRADRPADIKVAHLTLERNISNRTAVGLNGTLLILGAGFLGLLCLLDLASKAFTRQSP